MRAPWTSNTAFLGRPSSTSCSATFRQRHCHGSNEPGRQLLARASSRSAPGANAIVTRWEQWPRITEVVPEAGTTSGRSRRGTDSSHRSAEPFQPRIPVLLQGSAGSMSTAGVLADMPWADRQACACSLRCCQRPDHSLLLMLLRDNEVVNPSFMVASRSSSGAPFRSDRADVARGWSGLSEVIGAADESGSRHGGAIGRVCAKSRWLIRSSCASSAKLQATDCWDSDLPSGK